MHGLMAYVISNRPRHIIEAHSEVNGSAIHGLTYDKWEGVLGSAKISQAALRIKRTCCEERVCCISTLTNTLRHSLMLIIIKIKEFFRLNESLVKQIFWKMVFMNNSNFQICYQRCLCRCSAVILNFSTMKAFL